MEQERITEIERKLSESRFQFAIKCTHKVMQIMPKSDIAFSPHSIYEGLLMVYLMSSGAIEERLKLILCLSNICKYELIIYYLLGKDFEETENSASAASSDYDAERRCWIKATKFNHLFPLMKSIFNNRLEVFDPDNHTVEKLFRINIEIQSATENYICFPEELDDHRNVIELVLMNVSRLNAQFQILNCEFEASNVPILDDKRKRRSFFSDEFNMHVSEFLYTNEKMSLFVFLPAITPADFSSRRFTANSVCNLIERLSTEEAISTLRNLLDSDTPSEDADLTIDPIFELERSMPMRALLRDLGIEELLKPDAINLDSFFVNDDSVHLGNAVHRTHVKVTREDTVAGAINVIYTGQGIPSAGKRTNFQGNDFPFAWLIYDKQRRNVLFVGAFNDFNYFNNIPSFPPFIH